MQRGGGRSRTTRIETRLLGSGPCTGEAQGGGGRSITKRIETARTRRSGTTLPGAEEGDPEQQGLKLLILSPGLRQSGGGGGRSRTTRIETRLPSKRQRPPSCGGGRSRTTRIETP